MCVSVRSCCSVVVLCVVCVRFSACVLCNQRVFGMCSVCVFVYMYVCSAWVMCV